jgi:glycine/D-amino acid oxidase-like deaminating enzyme
LLVDARELAAGASGANGGGLFAGQQRAEFPSAFREFGLASRELYADLSEQPWAEFSWKRSGSLAIAPSEFSCSMREYVQQECDLARAAEYLTGGELRSLEPALSEDVKEGVFYADDGVVDPLRVALSLIRVLRTMGAILATDVRVTDFDATSNRIARVSTTVGDIYPGTTVLASGWSIGRLAEQCGARVPVQPAKGQLLATPPVDWRLNTNLLGTQLLRQLPSGEFVTGGTIEFVGEDYESTTANSQRITTTARQVLPALQDVPFARVWTGLRPHTPDQMPIIDRLPAAENGFLAAGHFTKGVLLAPITGKLVAEWIVDGEPSASIDELRLARFDGC